MSDNNTSIELIVNEPEEIKEPRFINTYRIGFGEGSFAIDFGRITHIDSTKRQINVVSKIILSADQMQSLILSLIKAAFDYEQKFEKEILPRKNQEEKK
ncbi:MAG: hypothetical protein PHS52_03760 [Desulfotomaculaceae bacterium]|nr:hypothetical protein [Desulfotomaculaceae bacterium]